jgi:hypothetical protein
MSGLDVANADDASDESQNAGVARVVVQGRTPVVDESDCKTNWPICGPLRIMLSLPHIKDVDNDVDLAAAVE